MIAAPECSGITVLLPGPTDSPGSKIVPVLRIHVVPPQGQPFDHLFHGESLVIGRSSTSDLPLPDRFLSRHHARIFRDGERYLVEDLGSRNGTLLNGEAVMVPSPITTGDVIRISGSTLAVHLDGAEAGAEVGGFESGAPGGRPPGAMARGAAPPSPAPPPGFSRGRGAARASVPADLSSSVTPNAS